MKQLRLQTICSLIPKVEVIADIGTDHGMVAEFIIKNNLCNTLIVNDISKLSLQKAVDRLSKFDTVVAGINRPKIIFADCCGSEVTHKTNIQIICAVIAGMGGKEILKIMEGLKPQEAVLSPQKNVDIVRVELVEMGYSIIEDLEITDKKKRYNIIKVQTADCNRH